MATYSSQQQRFTLMNITRTSLVIGLAYTLPLCIWLLTQLLNGYQANAPVAVIAHQCFVALIVMQVMLLPIFIPWQMRASTLWVQFESISILLIVPLPLLSIVWLMGAVASAEIATSLLAVCVFAVISYCLLTTWTRLIAQVNLRAFTMLATQAGLTVAAWQFHPQWLGYLGL